MGKYSLLHKSNEMTNKHFFGNIIMNKYEVTMAGKTRYTASMQAKYITRAYERDLNVMRGCRCAVYMWATDSAP